MTVTATPRVTACLIVKNEEKFLPDCLESLRGRVEEIVVADTGSTDATREVARDYGASVFDHAWQDDFSEARNAALTRAAGDWILYIDADERVVAPTRGALGQYIPHTGAAAARLLLQPIQGYTSYSELRLFRNDPRIRFQGVMHERVVETVRAVCAQDGTRVAQAHDIRLEHVGYEGDQSRKHVRNEPLLRKALSKDPDRVYCWFHLGATLIATGRQEEGLTCLDEALARAQVSGTPEELSIAATCCHIRAEIALKSDDPDAALKWADTGLTLFADNYGLMWMRARALLAQDRPRAAQQAVSPLLGLDPESIRHATHAFPKSLFLKDTPALLGAAHFEMGQFSEAGALFADAEAAAETPLERLEFRTKAQLARSKQDAEAGTTTPPPGSTE